MSDSRYPRLCLAKLQLLSAIDPTYKNNWYLQIKPFFDAIEHTNTWSNITLDFGHINSMLDIYNSKNVSSSLRLYPLLTDAETYKPSFYLNNFKSLNIVRTLAQLRLQNVHINSLLINKQIFTFNPSDVCSKCALQAPDNSQHTLYICPPFNDIREKFFPIVDRDYDLFYWAAILNSDNKAEIVKFINMINAILAQKSAPL